MKRKTRGWYGHRVAVVVWVLTTFWAVGLVAQDAGAPMDESEFRDWGSQFAGVYAFPSGRHAVIVPHTQFRVLSLFELETGMARPLEREDTDSFTYGPNVVSVSPTEGRLTFFRDVNGEIERVRWEQRTGSTSGRRLPLRREAVRFRNGERAHLSGWLITPPTDGPHPVAVILQPGANDRFKLWRTAMALAVEGIGVLVFDRRNVGESTGVELTDHHWSATQELAGDGAAAVRFARSHPRVDGQRVGVVGWSQGGWMGALVANRIPDLAFYVNIAGNSNPGWQQNRWNKLSSLRWEGFSEEEVSEAEAFLETHFGVMLGEAAWEVYQDAVAELAERPWFTWMEETFRYLWSSEAEAREYAELERDNVPERDFAVVSAPTLGLFFEFDESSPPETPRIFLRGRMRGDDPDVTVRVFPNTTHEAFVVNEFPTAAAQGGITRLAPQVFRELRSWVADRVANGDQRHFR
ncbi:MAG: alpha/beta fold hydrolase [Gemmatimonadota bacterium]